MKKVFLLLTLTLFTFSVYSQWAEHEHDMYCNHAKAYDSKDYVFLPDNRSELLSDYDVKFYFLDISVENNSVYVEGNVTVNAMVTAVTMDTFALELISEMNVDSVKVDGVIGTHSHVGDNIYIELASQLNQGDDVSVQVFYHGTPPTGGFFSGISTAYNNVYAKNVTWTLSEPFAAKDWWPTKQDLQDKADSCWVFITTSDENMAGSQGLLTAVTPMGNNKLRYEWKSKYPIDYYLISLAVADYQEYNIYAKPDELGGDSILVQNFIYDHPSALINFQTGIDRTTEFIELFSELFSLYPFWEEKYGHCLTELGGGMEHQTMSTMGGFSFGLVAHELGHMWFGDNVTCATWSDIWINEGFATYSDYLANEKINGYATAQDWLEGSHNYILSQPGGSVYIPPAQATNVSRIFNGRLSYHKGAALLHMMRFELQDDSVFFDVMHEYQAQYADSVATGMDFKAVLESVSGMDFTDFFDQWYFGEGYPKYTIIWNQDGGDLNMNVTQTTSTTVTPLFKMTMPYYLEFDDGTDTTILLYQTDNFTQFSVPMTKTITDIDVDPENWVLDQLIGIAIGIEETQSPAYFTFGPNPVRDNIRLFLPNHDGGIYQVILTDLSGREIQREEKTGSEVVIDMSSLSKGAYLIRILSEEYGYSRKVVRL